MENWTEKNRNVIILLVGVITLIMLYGFRFIKVESDMTKWLKKDAKEVKSLNYVSSKFGGKDVALVGIESDSIFTYAGFKLLSELQDSFEAIKGVSSITSLMNILDIKGTEGSIQIDNLVDRYNLPKDALSIQKLKKYILSKDMYRGRIISEDGRVALFVIRLTKDAEKVYVGSMIKKKAKSIVSSSNIPVKLYFSGTPMVLKSINSSIMNDMIKLVPIVVLIVVFVLYAGMRNTYGVFLPLLVVITASIWSIGLMGYLHVPLSVVSNTMPVLLIAIGTAYGIHMLSTYARHIRGGLSKTKAIKVSQKEVFVPVLLAGLTTMTAFFSFLGSYIVSITHFGIFTGLGVAFAIILSIIFIPAMLYKINYKVDVENKADFRSIWYERIMEHLFEFIAKREFLSVFVAILIILLGILGFLRLKTSSNLMYYFPKSSEIRRSATFLRKNFKGDIPVYILIKGDLQNPGVLQEMIDFEKFMRTRHDIGFPNSYADLIMNLNESAFGYRAIPETKGEVQNLGFMLEGRPVLKQLVESDYKEGIISANALQSAYKPVKEYFDKRLHRSLALVYMDTIPLNSPLYDYLASQTSWRIMQDAAFRGIKLDTSKIKDILLWSLKKQYVINLKDVDELTHKIKGVFSSNDIKVSDDQIRHLLPFVIDSIDTLKLEAYIFNIIPSDIRKDDPEIVEDIKDGIISAKDAFIRDKKIDVVLHKVLSCMKADENAQHALLKDIKGDIYTFFKKNVYVPSEVVEKGSSLKIEPVYSGILPVYEELSKSIYRSQIRSMLIALFVVFILVWLDSGSIWGGLVAVFTIILVISINFGIMGLLGVNLDAGTMLVASVAIGIGVDYSIHFISHLKRRVLDGLSLEEGIRRTMIEKGHAILVNAFTVGLGFLVAVFGTLIPIRNFGWLLFLTMLTSATLSLTFLPGLILFLKGPFNKIFKAKQGGV